MAPEPIEVPERLLEQLRLQQSASEAAAIERIALRVLQHLPGETQVAVSNLRAYELPQQLRRGVMSLDPKPLLPVAEQQHDGGTPEPDAQLAHRLGIGAHVYLDRDSLGLDPLDELSGSRQVV